MGLGMRSAYCASKAAVHALFRCLRIEEPTIRISTMVIDSFTGSSFRDNSIVKPKEELE